MADGVEPQFPAPAEAARRYSAFISYSSRDAAFATRLHRRLESYRLPRGVLHLSGKAVSGDRRLGPVFRDRDELSASYDLTTAVRDALLHSDSLIVVCSPHAAASEWVGREIELFRSIHGDRRILAALVEGTPQTALHRALLGGRLGLPLQPLAADFRAGGDGSRLALLKLVAGVTDTALDQLVQRDAQRQVRRITGLAAAGVASVALLAAVGLMALTARADADTQRARAGGLGTFMVGDLRHGLDAAGRLDLRIAANQAALTYFRDHDLARLPPDDQLQAAATMQSQGEAYENRGDEPAARDLFGRAYRITGRLLAARPEDPKRIFAHAQSEYWVGWIDLRSGDMAGAKAGFEAYAALASKLIKKNSASIEWQHELAYAKTNLGMLALRRAGGAQTARQHFSIALTTTQAIATRAPDDVDLRREIANLFAWLGDSQRLLGDFHGARDSRLAERRILESVSAADPRNVAIKAELLGNELGLARIAAAEGDPAAALAQVKDGLDQARALAVSQPDNASVAKRVRMLELFKVRFSLDLPKAGRPPGPALHAMLGNCHPTSSHSSNQEIADFCAALQARMQLEAGDAGGARRLLEPMNKRIKAGTYSERWGLDFAEESRSVHMDAVAPGGAK